MSKKEHEEMVKNLPTHEWTNEQQLEYQLEIQKEFHKKSLERISIENSDLYVETVLLKRKIRSLQSELDEIKLNNK
jgi:hypothetical protein